MKYPLVPLVQGTMARIYALIGSSGTKSQLNPALRRHSMTRRRKSSTVDPGTMEMAK
uniref:Adipogenin n=1 Tax=Jaculus jaculus TaxID=51337 RepID=A0A8C5P0S9_JACJA